eukprot:3336170-Pyramimonas_sp.AAC.1
MPGGRTGLGARCESLREAAPRAEPLSDGPGAQRGPNDVGHPPLPASELPSAAWPSSLRPEPTCVTTMGWT